MQYIIIALATAASFVSAQSPATTSSASAISTGAVVPVGGDCIPGDIPCALGSQCYATNFMLRPRCGNFQAACTSDQQCAFNNCKLEQAGGFCNGLLSTSSSPASSSAPASIASTPAGESTPDPSLTVTAPPGSLPLGAECNALANPSQCVAGIQCWASKSGSIARCGNFNAACSSNAECAYNACNNGICSGSLPSSSGNATMTTQSTGSSKPSGSATNTVSTTATTTSIAEFTGAASVANVASGVLAVVFGAAAWVL